jgi:hypothetical protein
MGYALLWVEGLLIALLCLALAARKAAIGFWVGGVGAFLLFLLFLGLGAFATHATAPWQRDYGNVMDRNLFLFSLSWLVAFLIGGGLLLRRAFQRAAPGLMRTGAGWPRQKLWLGLGGMVLAFGFTFWNLNLAARADLAVARQEAGDLLFNTTPLPSTDSENAARLYVEAGKDLVASIRNPWNDAARKGMALFPKEDVNWKDLYVVELVAKQEKVLALLRRAAAMPPCSLDRRRSLDEFLPYDYDLAQLRWKEITLLAVDARVKAVQGDRGRAFEDVAAILGSTRHVQTFLSGPEILGTHATAWRTVEDVLRLAPATKEALPTVSLPEGVSPFRALVREMAVMGMIWPAWFSVDPLRIAEIQRDKKPWTTPPLIYGMETLVIPASRILFTPSELSYSHKKWAEYRRILQTAPEGTSKDWADVRTIIFKEPAGLFSALMIKPKEQMLLREGGKLAALEQLARAGLAAERYRHKHGKYPEHLEQLVPDFLPAMPVDPRDGQALQIKRFDELTVLYTLENNAELANTGDWDAAKYKEQPVFRLYH